MLNDLLDWLAGTPQEKTTRLEELKPGRVKLEGRLHADEPIAAAIGRARCAGYFYHSSYMVGSRMRGYMRRRLRDALVYAPTLSLELEGGAVLIVPRRNDDWSDLHHKALLEEEYEGFEATERLIRDGARVQVIGTARRLRGGEGLAVHFNELHLLELPPGAAKAPRKAPQERPALDGFRIKPSKKKGGKK